MTLHLDSSAIVKLIVDEPESDALRSRLARTPRHASSALAHVEVLRAVSGTADRTKARQILHEIALLDVSSTILEDAATLSVEPFLRSLDAIHLATARQFGAELTAVVTYDRRMVDAATALRIPVESPA